MSGERKGKKGHRGTKRESTHPSVASVFLLKPGLTASIGSPHWPGQTVRPHDLAVGQTLSRRGTPKTWVVLFQQMHGGVSPGDMVSYCHPLPGLPKKGTVPTCDRGSPAGFVSFAWELPGL